MKIGIIGFGKMGAAIAARLVECGYEVVAWSRDIQKVEISNIAVVGSTPQQVIQKSDVIISILANDEATERAYFGEDGICSARLDGKIVIEMCTMLPERAKQLCQAVRGAGGAFLECPVGGTVKPARDGALVGMAAGDPTTFDKVKPILGELTRRLDFLGEVGNAAAMKLAINLPLMVYWGALGEAVALLGRYNINVEQAFDILTDSSGAIGPAKARQAPIIELIKNGQSGVSNFAIDQAIKDMSLMKSQASQNGVDCPIITASLDTAKLANDAGWDKKDISLLAAWRRSGA
ncbi:MAG: NAD(P)-dependent oxidoreductase [Alphaproteobacteria bacterium]